GLADAELPHREITLASAGWTAEIARRIAGSGAPSVSIRPETRPPLVSVIDAAASPLITTSTMPTPAFPRANTVHVPGSTRVAMRGLRARTGRNRGIWLLGFASVASPGT